MTDDDTNKINRPHVVEETEMMKMQRVIDEQAERIAELEEYKAAADARIAELEVDAARWSAFVNCARIRLLGCAGLTDEPNNPCGEPWGNYGHIGLEAWTIYDEPTDKNAEIWLTRFADKARALLPSAPDGGEG